MNTILPPLPRIMLEPLVRMGLLEDLGRAGDLTSQAIVPPDQRTSVQLVSRQNGVIAGLDLAAITFELIDPGVKFEIACPDGSHAIPGQVIATIDGNAIGILTAERTALNFLSHLSGIATATAGLVHAVRDYKATIVCTRKTTPGLRAIEKYAVRAGGGGNHRFGLDDAVLIKDNHIAIAGSAETALKRARAAVGHMVKIEIEIDSLDQLEEILELGADVIMLDNMSPPLLAEAVKRIDGRAITEASGRINLETAPAMAASGVDLISVGWLTHSAPILDIGLDYGAA